MNDREQATVCRSGPPASEALSLSHSLTHFLSLTHTLTHTLSLSVSLSRGFLIVVFWSIRWTRPRLHARAYARKRADLLPKLLALRLKNSELGLRRHFLPVGGRTGERKSKEVLGRASKGDCCVVGREFIH